MKRGSTQRNAKHVFRCGKAVAFRDGSANYPNLAKSPVSSRLNKAYSNSADESSVSDE